MARRRTRSDAPDSGPVDVRPVDVDGIKAVAIGTILWSIAFVVLAVFSDRLDAYDRGWWLWTCLAGVGLGLLGLEYCRKRRDALADEAADGDADGDADEAADEAEVDEAADLPEPDGADVNPRDPGRTPPR